MPVQTAAGASLSLSVAAPATYDQAGFVALTFTLLAEVVSLGEHGGTTALILHEPLDTRRVYKLKGTINDGGMAVGLGMDLSDAGQILLIDGALGGLIDTDHSFELLYASGEIEYFQAKIMAYTRNPGSVNQVVAANTTLELVNAIVDA